METPLSFIKTCLTKARPRFGPCSFVASSIPNACAIEFCKELVYTTRPGIGHQSNFWLHLSPGHLFAFPKYDIFESQGLMETPLTFVKTYLTNARPRFGLSSFGASSIPNACGIKFCKELPNKICPGISYQSDFLARPFTGAPLHFP